MNCPWCGADEFFIVEVWESPEAFQNGEYPSYLGCKSCNRMKEWKVPKGVSGNA